MHTVLKLAQLRWTGHFIRMTDERLLKKVFYYRRTTGGKVLSRWPEETLQRHPQSLSEGFRHTNGVFRTDCTGAIKVARSHKKGAALYEKKNRICEAERKHGERKQMGHHQLIP